MSTAAMKSSRYASLTAVLLGLLGAGVFYVVSTLMYTVQFLTSAPFDVDDLYTDEVETVSLAEGVGLGRPADLVVAGLLIVAGCVGFFGLKRGERFRRATLLVFVVGVALAPFVGFVVNFVVYDLMGPNFGWL